MNILYPLIFTAVTAVIAALCIPKSKPTNYVPDIGAAIAAGYILAIWMIVSLLAWLAWALLR